LWKGYWYIEPVMATNDIVVYSFLAWLITESITMHSVHLSFQCSKVYRLHINYHMTKKNQDNSFNFRFQIGNGWQLKTTCKLGENSSFSNMCNEVWHTVSENAPTVNCSLIFKPKRQYIVHLFFLFFSLTIKDKTKISLTVLMLIQHYEQKSLTRLGISSFKLKFCFQATSMQIKDQ
jgi:hypothetical protein